MTAPSRDFTVAVYVTLGDKLLFLYHRKLQRWLPPGGHIEAGELPDVAALREVQEETGLAVRSRSQPRATGALPPGSPAPLARPEGVQLEDIAPGHQHIDFIYFAEVTPGTPETPRGNDESQGIGWFTLAELAGLGATEEVLSWGRLALNA